MSRVTTALTCAIALYASGAVAAPFTTVVEALMVEHFNDPQVKCILMSNGIQVHVTNSDGSLEINAGVAIARPAATSGPSKLPCEMKVFALSTADRMTANRRR